MHIEGDALVLEEAEVAALVRQIYLDYHADIVQFLPREEGGDDGVELTRLVIPLEGAKVLGLTITVKESEEG